MFYIAIFSLYNSYVKLTLRINIMIKFTDRNEPYIQDTIFIDDTIKVKTIEEVLANMLYEDLIDCANFDLAIKDLNIVFSYSRQNEIVSKLTTEYNYNEDDLRRDRLENDDFECGLSSEEEITALALMIVEDSNDEADSLLKDFNIFNSCLIVVYLNLR